MATDKKPLPTLPDVKAKLESQGIMVGASAPAELVARIKADTAKFTPIIKASGARAD